MSSCLNGLCGMDFPTDQVCDLSSHESDSMSTLTICWIEGFAVEFRQHDTNLPIDQIWQMPNATSGGSQYSNQHRGMIRV